MNTAFLVSVRVPEAGVGFCSVPEPWIVDSSLLSANDRTPGWFVGEMSCVPPDRGNQWPRNLN